jgi:DNA (cytosine-5)-methyltransferase 1
MRIGSLFSGAGGLDMAVEAVFGGTVVWHSEIDKAASKVLAHRYPDVPNIGDITAIDWDAVEPIDILCGGWPCQPWSIAGSKKGTEDDRALWPYVEGAIRRLRPGIVVLENVPNIIVLGELARAVGSLAALGYDTQWACLRASEVGAAHNRERVFIVATNTDDPRWGEQCRSIAASQELPPSQHIGYFVDEVTALPTPSASDGIGGGPNNPENRLAQGHQVQLLDLGMASAETWARYATAIYRWRCVIDRVAPPPTEMNRLGKPRLNAAFSEWLMGWPEGWVTDSAIGIGRNDQLKICGNGVVPQQAEAALRYLVQVTAQ